MDKYVELQTELGPVTALLQGYGRAFVRVDPDKPLALNTKTYVGSAHLVYEDGRWVTGEHIPSWSDVHQTDWRKQVAPSFRTKLTLAVIKALTEYATPRRLAEADLSAANETVERAVALQEEAEQHLNKARDNVRNARQIRARAANALLDTNTNAEV